MAEPEKVSGATAPLTAAAYEQYTGALKRYLVKRVRRPEDASDLCQEIFELFLRRRSRSEAVHNPLAYLFRIAFHVVSDALARQKRDPLARGSQPGLGEEATDYEMPSSDHAEELAVQDDVLQALSTLPENYLTVLMLVEGEGMSYQEAADASGFTCHTIRTYVMHARAALKLALDDQRQAHASKAHPK
jgi:RNA polymerase sigma-70 factor (ECF subfamily)